MRVFARTPLDISQITIARGQVYLIPERCKGCEVCVHFCPQDVLSISDERNAKGYRIPMVKDGNAGLCVHCGFCTLVCPEFAIFTLPINGDQDG
ncbi:MAG: 4Fe-4S binding protein [Anaerolineales bacterium]|jgi:2-oxoglutarate ferredoxin oxidoreductase subunit delta